MTINGDGMGHVLPSDSGIPWVEAAGRAIRKLQGTSLEQQVVEMPMLSPSASIDRLAFDVGFKRDANFRRDLEIHSVR